MTTNPNPIKSNSEAEWRKQALNIVADLSHSMRNPFSTMQSYLNILEMEDYNYTPEGLKEITDILRDTVEKSFKHIDEKIAVLREELDK